MDTQKTLSQIQSSLYELGYNFYVGMDPAKTEKGGTILRYWQVGIPEPKDTFTGIIQDYCGGGCYDYFHYLQDWNLYHGIYTQKNLDEENEELDEDQQEYYIDRAHPKLVTEIYDFLKRIADYSEEEYCWVINDTFRDLCPALGTDNRVYSNGLFHTISVGNTYFS